MLDVGSRELRAGGRSIRLQSQPFEILLLLLPDAYKNLKDDGYFILSGIIESKKAELIAALISNGFEIEQEKQMKDWVCLICTKNLED